MQDGNYAKVRRAAALHIDYEKIMVTFRHG